MMIGKMPVKKLALLVLAVLLSAAVLDLLWWFISPGEAVVNQPGNVFNLDLTEATPGNCIFDEFGHHIPANGDPQLAFSLSGKMEVKSVAVRLQQPLGKKSYVQVYYGTDEITEENSVGFYAKAGTREFYFNLPGDYYTFLRLDINADCWLDSVSCGDQPASFFRTPPFRPLRILLVAAVLGLALFFFTRPKVKSVIRTLDHNWINPETRKLVVTILYAIFAMAMLLHHIAVTLWYPAIAKGTDIKFLSVLFPLFAFVSILLGHMWRDKGFWFLAALVLLEYLRLAVPRPVVAADFSSILYALVGCYSVGKALGSKALKPFLKVFCSICTAAVLFLCVLGLYAAWTGTEIYNWGGEAISTTNWLHRLQLVYFCGIAGPLVSSVLFVTIIGLCLYNVKALWFMGIPVCIILLVTSCLTGSRTAYISTAVSFGIIFSLLIYDRLKQADTNSHGSFPVWKTLILFSLFLVITMSLFFVQSYIPDCFNYIRTKGILTSHALAEETDTFQSLAQRGVLQIASIDDVSSGRLSIWSKILRLGFPSFSDVLWGQSVYQPMNIINVGVSNRYGVISHCHNLWLQTLLESGLSGLLLLLSLQGYFLVCAFRLMKNRALPFWQRILPVPTILILIGELFEHTTGLAFCFPQLTFLYLFMGLTIALGAKAKSPENSESVLRS